MSFDELPDTLLERATMLEQIMTEHATGGSSDTSVYEHLRRDFTGDMVLKGLLPTFVRTSRSLSAFWPWIKEQAGTYAERRRLISEAFTPLIEHLEGVNNAPGDTLASDALRSFDPEGVHEVWSKAIERRNTDAEGAITLARTLLETVCKRILDGQGLDYSDRDDLPKLYQKAGRSLNLGPDQHSEEPLKAILGGAITVVNGLGTLRNRLSDAHGRGGRPIKPSPRHASLAVNTAGAIATFLVETYNERLSHRA